MGEKPAPQARHSLAQHAAAGGVLGKSGKWIGVPSGTAHFSQALALSHRPTIAELLNNNLDRGDRRAEGGWFPRFVVYELAAATLFGQFPGSRPLASNRLDSGDC